jgi:hypothetical protein
MHGTKRLLLLCHQFKRALAQLFPLFDQAAMDHLMALLSN